jgi:hypothetical protein
MHHLSKPTPVTNWVTHPKLLEKPNSIPNLIKLRKAMIKF